MNTKHLEITKDNILCLLLDAYHAAQNDPENIKYGLTIDMRGFMSTDIDHSTENIYATSEDEFESVAEQIKHHYDVHGEHAFVDAQMYWNDAKFNYAEGDDYGVMICYGNLSQY